MDFHFEGMSRSDYLFNLGKSRTLSGNFLGSIRLLEEASSLYLADKDYLKYMDCASILLKIYRELQDFNKLSSLREEIQNLAWKENVEITVYAYYALAQHSLFKNNLEEALEELKKSMSVVNELMQKARTNKDVVEMLKVKIKSIFPSYGIVCYLIRKKELVRAKRELESLEDLLSSFDIYSYEKEKDLENDTSSKSEQEMKIKKVLEETQDMRERVYLSTKILKTTLLREESRYDDIEEILWDCYDKIKSSKDLCTIVSFFYYLGKNYMDKQDYSQASIFLNLAKRSIDSDNFKFLNSHIEECLKKLQDVSSNNYDLIINFTTNSIIEKNKGKIDFKNQFILIDLLKLFLSKPGARYSKEQMVEKVWKQNYDASVHDNKIYVTIKRLRELIEPDCHRPQYIFRGKEGYYLNEKAKVLCKEQPAYIPNAEREREGEILL